MKILVIQLARLGDIYLSWPALRALKRKNPEAHVTLLTRSSFVPATLGLEAVDKVLELPTSEILSPLVQDLMDIPEAHGRLAKFVENLKSNHFDQVINLSFSPTSSYLTHLLQNDSTKVCGYTRTDDGFLAIPDPMSAYFYAQVGLGKSNRFHLAEIFGTLFGVDLEFSDWATPELTAFEVPVKGPFIALHIGASEAHKSIPAGKWTSVLSHLRALNPVPVVLLGSNADLQTAETILSSVPSDSVVSLVGKTSLAQTMTVISKASLLVGPDSAPMHMASLTKTRCLNISLGRVNFWETGPRAAGSWVVRAGLEVDVHSDRIARAIHAMLNRQRPEVGIIQVQSGTPSYTGLFPKEAEFHWKLTQAIYQGTPFPEPTSPNFWQAHTQLNEINGFIGEQLAALQKGASLADRAPFIDRGEEVIDAIAKLVPAWGPLVRWYQTEKVRIGPGSTEQVLAKTQVIQSLLQQVLDLYSDMEKVEATRESEAP